jgi:hypothetical protein
MELVGRRKEGVYFQENKKRREPGVKNVTLKL